MILNKKGDLSAVHPVHQLKCSYYCFISGVRSWLARAVSFLRVASFIVCLCACVSVFVCVMAVSQFSFSTYGSRNGDHAVRLGSESFTFYVTSHTHRNLCLLCFITNGRTCLLFAFYSLNICIFGLFYYHWETLRSRL